MQLRFLLVAALGLSLCACTGKAGDDEDEDDGDGSGDGGEAMEIAYPQGNRVLIYNGNGGAESDSTGRGAVTQLEALCEGEWGWLLDHRDYIPEDLSRYRLIGMMGLGRNGDEEFSVEEMDAFRLAMSTGTRLLLMADVEACNAHAMNGLLEHMGLSTRFNGDGTDANRIITATSISDSQQPTAGVSEVQLKDPCYVDPGDGHILIKDDDRNVLASLERPAPTEEEELQPGDVVLIGDYQFLDDGGGLDAADNLLMTQNLLQVEP